METPRRLITTTASRSSWLALWVCSTYVYGVAWLLAAVVAPTLIGWQPAVLVSGSMSPAMLPGDVVLFAPPDSQDLTSGDVIAFDDSARSGRLTTHRIVEEALDGAGYRTKGDANRDPDSTPVPRDAVRGVGRLIVPGVGLPLHWAQTGRMPLFVAWLAATVLALYLMARSTSSAMPPLTHWSLPLHADITQRPSRKRRGSGPAVLRAHADRRWPAARRVAFPLVLACIAVSSVIATTSAAFSSATSVPSNSFEAIESFGVSFVDTIGSVTCGGTASTVDVATTVSAGNTVIVRLALANAGPGVVSVTDSRSNTYSIDADVTGASTRTVIASGYVGTALQPGDTITVSSPAGAVESVVAAAYANIAPTDRVDVSATTSGSGTTPSAAVTTTWEETLLYAAVASDGASTYTEAPGWQTHEHVQASCAGDVAEDHGATDTRSTTGASTYAPTLSMAADWTAAVVAYKAKDTDAPAAPDLSGSVGDTENTLSWTSVSDPSPPVTYQLYRDGALVYDGTATTFIDTALSNGATYDYVVRATDGAGNQSGNSGIAALAPSAGASIKFVKSLGQASCAGAGAVITVPAGGVAKDSTIILRIGLRQAGGAITATDNRGNTYTVDRDITSGNARTAILSAYVATALAAGDSISVTHANGRAEGVAAAQFSGIAATGRVDASAAAGGNSAAPATGVTTATGQTLLYGAVANTSNVTYTEAAGWTTQAHQALSCGGPSGTADSHGAYRSVFATGSFTYGPTMSGAQEWAAAAVAYRAAGPDTTAPAAPTLSATPAHEEVALSWNTVTDRSEPVSYRLFRDGTKIYEGTGASFVDTDVTNGTTYAYVLRAVDAVGNVATESNQVDIAPVADTTAPAAPVLTGAVADSQNTIDWTAVIDPTAPVTYRLFRDGALVYDGGSRTYTDTPVANDANHVYVVKAVDGAGNASADSTSFTATASTVSSAVIGKAEGGDSGYVRQGGGYYVYANAAGASTSVRADVSALTGGQSAVALTSGTYTAGGVSYNYRSALLTADAVLAEGAKGWTIRPAGTDIAAAFTVTVDNAGATAVDVQTANISGGTGGLAETGDQLVLTFSEPVAPSSILAGWDGTSTSVAVRLTDSASNDTVTVFNAADTVQLPLGVVDTEGNVVSANSLFTATMTRSGASIAVTLGTLQSGTLRTDNQTTPMVWTAQAGPVDRAGNVAGASAISETGAADLNF